jgi:hypothetical protein
LSSFFEPEPRVTAPVSNTTAARPCRRTLRTTPDVSQVEALVRHGYLAEEDLGDPNAVQGAVDTFLGDALWFWKKS